MGGAGIVFGFAFILLALSCVLLELGAANRALEEDEWCRGDRRAAPSAGSKGAVPFPPAVLRETQLARRPAGEGRPDAAVGSSGQGRPLGLSIISEDNQ